MVGVLDSPFPVLYATSARLGGPGLDAVALKSVRAAQDAGRLGRALAFDFQTEAGLDRKKIRSLRWHPVRLLSPLGSTYYYSAKKRTVDRAAARELAAGEYGLFHGWSGESVQTLRIAKEMGVPSLLEIPTWHRHKGKEKPLRLTKSERERAEVGGWQGWKNRLLITRQQVLEEYDLADLLLVLSEKAAETFRAAGIPEEKLFRHQRGVDPAHFTPAENPPEIFRAVFAGALIHRKGVHHLLDVWKRLGLKNAELTLAGTPHAEIAPLLKDAPANVKVLGFVRDMAEVYRSGSVHLFPSECEGSAKVTYEAASCGLPQITTREAGDIVQDGVNGILIPPNDPDALAEAILRLYGDAALRAQMGAAGRERIVKHFTWEHFRTRLLEAYAAADLRRKGAVGR